MRPNAVGKRARDKRCQFDQCTVKAAINEEASLPHVKGVMVFDVKPRPSFFLPRALKFFLPTLVRYSRPRHHGRGLWAVECMHLHVRSNFLHNTQTLHTQNSVRYSSCPLAVFMLFLLNAPRQVVWK